ncbi:hypothetical protein V8G54_030148 [Vigna mungo]|uniref:Uncharacterized protein n=1 Tax=Vigna mungo TaxID=3915 RepID=A0AAQ3MV35_VIGMU
MLLYYFYNSRTILKPSKQRSNCKIAMCSHESYYYSLLIKRLKKTKVAGDVFGSSKKRIWIKVFHEFAKQGYPDTGFAYLNPRRVFGYKFRVSGSSIRFCFVFDSLDGSSVFFPVAVSRSPYLRSFKEEIVKLKEELVVLEENLVADMVVVSEEEVVGLQEVPIDGVAHGLGGIIYVLMDMELKPDEVEDVKENSEMDDKQSIFQILGCSYGSRWFGIVVCWRKLGYAME